MHLDLRGLFDRLAVEHGGFEHPLLDSVKGGIAEDRLAANHFEVMRFAVFSDCEFDHDLTADPARLGNEGINSLNFPEDLHGLKV